MMYYSTFSSVLKHEFSQLYQTSKSDVIYINANILPTSLSLSLKISVLFYPKFVMLRLCVISSAIMIAHPVEL